ncbi:hypothetical protein LTR37_003671 [Vermiconidia calcicola]|uniref:Uncharacterized protein n=1 Tax=Vermiconidia calcicola TaxID=1690605 RepID=A0ACC3NR02_9PEZI|nr:hypothetical protein LTR37_003671 [Vermiconidia calcicola]
MDGKLHENNDSAFNDKDDFNIRGAAARSKLSGKPTKDATTETCTICLESISERAVAAPCNHLTFDFLCLVSWLQERSTCPLCTLAVTEVQYDFRSPKDYKTYRPPKPDSNNVSESAFQRSRRRRGQGFVRRRAERRNPSAEQAAASGEDPALERRRRVYRDKLFSLHVGANRISQYRDLTHEDFANSPELQSRAPVPRGGNREFLLEYIVAILKTSELKGASGHAEDLLADYLGRDNARLLLHELEAWLRSPYTALEAWDRHAQYADGGRSIGMKQAASPA